MSNPVDVQWFDSTMIGAPTLAGVAGNLITVLDACLVNGFNTVTLSSLVVASGVATATVSGGHGFLDHVVALVAGAAPSGLNGNKRLTRVSSTVFTFDATGISDQTATGTITAKMAPVGWTKAYSGTNKAAYARTDAAATAMLLRIDDSPAQYPTLIMYETMSDIDTGTGAAPTSGTLYTAKSSTANSTARPWRLYADSRMLYLFVNADGSNWSGGFCFGDLETYASPDAYACCMVAHPSASYNYNYLYIFANATASYLARSSSQAGAAVAAQRYSHLRTAGGLGYNAQSWVDGDPVNLWPVECWESVAMQARGLMPGLWNPVHNSNPPDGTIIVSPTRLTGHRLLVQQTSNASYRCALDLTGPWR